jgi:hypothetical protein
VTVRVSAIALEARGIAALVIEDSVSIVGVGVRG